MAKRGVDQTTAWILAVVLAGLFFAGLYGIAVMISKSPNFGQTVEADGHGDDHVDESGVEGGNHGDGAQGKHGVHWGYTGSVGPDHWANLSEDYTLCGKGTSQSPVDLDHTSSSSKLMPLKFHYPSGPVTLGHNGHTVEVRPQTPHYAVIEGHRYDLVQLHFHTPSEHKVNGVPYDMEMHLVHKDTQGRLVVIGVLFEERDPNKGLESIWPHLPRDRDEVHDSPVFDIMMVLPNDRRYYYYKGSLTTPPCSEDLNWYVLKEPVTVSSRQIDLITSIIHRNARPIQVLHGRKILESVR